jgi:predicted metalloprotease with PDZ domain
LGTRRTVKGNVASNRPFADFMRIVLLLPALMAAAPVANAQVTIQGGRGGYAYVTTDPDRPMIGVSTRNSGKRDTLGLLVESVTSGGPAEKAGIEEGDRLVSVNSVNLRLSAADAGEPDMDGVTNRRLIRELEKHKAGDEVEFRVYRDGNTRSIRVKTVAAEDLNQEVFASTLGGWSRTDSDRAALGLSLGGNGSRRDTLGILVVGVSDDGPAAKAGVDEGDRLAAINSVDLRVASEDAGDWQASSARINRLNRELEKLKAGDTVQLRIISSGQVRTLRVGSVKASEVQGEGAFFRFNNGSGGTITLPRARAMKVRPPGAFEFQNFLDGASAKLEMEKALRSFDDAIKTQKEETSEFQKQLKSQLKSGALKKASLSRSVTI